MLGYGTSSEHRRVEDTHFPMTLRLIILGDSPDVRLLDHRVALFGFLEGKDRV